MSRRCPRCTEVLAEPVGALEEEACAACGGRLLSARGMERLLDERRVDRELLRELSTGYADEGLRCPACETAMRTLQLKGERVDLCFGCGALWLDPGELSRLGEGRHEEIVTEEMLANLQRAIAEEVEVVDEEAARARVEEREERAQRTFWELMGFLLWRGLLLSAGAGLIALGVGVSWDQPWHTSVRCERKAPGDEGRCLVTERYWRGEETVAPGYCLHLAIDPGNVPAFSCGTASFRLEPQANQEAAKAQLAPMIQFNRGAVVEVEREQRTLGRPLWPLISFGLFGAPFVYFGLRRRRPGR